MRKIIFTLILSLLVTIIFSQEKVVTNSDSNGKDDFIYKEGKVGIGTTNPQSLLDVSTKVRIGDSAPLGGKGLELYHYTNNKSYINSYNRDDNSALPLHLTASYFFFEKGNIGIGTASPNAKLDIIGSNTLMSIEGIGDGRVFLGYDNNLDSGVLGIESGDLDLRQNMVDGDITSGTTALFIQEQTGNIGIGVKLNSNTKGYKLAVNGKIGATEIEVVSQITSDFVFEEDFKLKSLEEVERFIKENKHLPEIPSAKEFKKQGQNLAKTDDLLLRKIEELTLYMIEQNKKTQKLVDKTFQLEKENDLLREKIKKLEDRIKTTQNI